jgi:hypothetical protein
MEAHRQDESELETAVDDAIAACDGDLRATIRALLVANSFLYAEMERFRALISTGFARGKLTLRDLP